MARRDIQTDGVPAICLSCDARRHGLCATLNPEQLTALAQAATRHTTDEGGELVGDAEQVEAYSNVLSGVVKLTKTLSDGRQQIVGLQFAPDFLGRPFKEESEVNAEAATEVSLCSFPKAVVERIMKEQPELERHLLRQALDELDEARDWMLTLGRKTAMEKVASFLLLIAKNASPTDEANRSVVFDLPLTRVEIADFLGLTVETVSRQITKLRGSGLIRIENNRHIMVENIEMLEVRSGL